MIAWTSFHDKFLDTMTARTVPSHWQKVTRSEGSPGPQSWNMNVNPKSRDKQAAQVKDTMLRAQSIVTLNEQQ